MSRAWILVATIAAGCEYDDDLCFPGEVLYLQHTDHAWAEYVDADTYRSGVLDLAAGGTERFEVIVSDGCGGGLPQSPIASLSTSAPIVAEKLGETTFEVRAIAEGEAAVRVVTENGLAFNPVMRAKKVTSVILATDELGRPGAFLESTPLVKIVLLSAEQQPLIDRRLTVAGPIRAGERWNRLDLRNVPTGDHEITVLAGESGWPVTATIVDDIDAVVAESASLVTPSSGSRQICFHAMRGALVVGGVPWELEYDTYAGSVGYHPNCVTVWKGVDRPVPRVVTARALGFSATTTVTFTD